MNVFIICGGINSGKTSATENLYMYLDKKAKVFSVISKKMFDGCKRNYMVYVNGRKVGISVSVEDGMVVFENTFSKITLTEDDIAAYDVFIVDEVGRLELEKRGFFDIVSSILKSKKISVLSIRESLMLEVVSFFGIKQYRAFKPYEWNMALNDIICLLKI